MPRLHMQEDLHPLLEEREFIERRPRVIADSLRRVGLAACPGSPCRAISKGTNRFVKQVKRTACGFRNAEQQRPEEGRRRQALIRSGLLPTSNASRKELP